MHLGQQHTQAGSTRRLWLWIGAVAAVCVAALLTGSAIVVHRANPILRGRVIETLSARFHARVELDSIDVSPLKGLQVSGTGLRIFAPDDVVAAGATAPIIAVGQFSFHTGLRALFERPMHVGTVHVRDLSIHIPPRAQRNAGAQQHATPRSIKILADEILVDHSELVIDTDKPDKNPKRFELQHIRLRDVGSAIPLAYDATLVNAIPRGDIHATGHFGPWNDEEPGESPVDGRYTFDHADLGTIKGIGGTLSSTGTFGGQLNRIVADGATDTPNFTLDTANRPTHLRTTFHAIIDGTSGDTYLQPVQATLGTSQFTCEGAVLNIKGQGHRTELDIHVPAGRLTDFLELAVKTTPPVLQSTLGMKVHLVVPPGKQSVTHKLSLKGTFTLHRMHFTNPEVQDKVDMLSMRAQGDAKNAKPGAEDVNSQMSGLLTMNNGQLTLSRLFYQLPGADVALDGVYSLDGKTYDFHGKVRTVATVSKMVATPWKSFLLKAIDPFFRKHGAGAEVPIKITGTQGEPKFGLDLHPKKSEKDAEKDDLQERRDELTPDGRIRRRKPPGLPISN